jgi:Holliday junction resolvase RusA-like endonuclease
MQRITKWIDCNPPRSTTQSCSRMKVLASETGGQFVQNYKTPAGQQLDCDLMSLLYPHRPENRFTSGIDLELIWRFPWRKAETKTNRAKHHIPHVVTPDADNVSKMALDAMTRIGFWNDDAQVSRLTVAKEWGDRPGIGLDIGTAETCGLSQAETRERLEQAKAIITAYSQNKSKAGLKAKAEEWLRHA